MMLVQHWLLFAVWGHSELLRLLTQVEKMSPGEVAAAAKVDEPWAFVGQGSKPVEDWKSMAKIQQSMANFASKYKASVQQEGKAQQPLNVGEGKEERHIICSSLLQVSVHPSLWTLLPLAVQPVCFACLRRCAMETSRHGQSQARLH